MLLENLNRDAVCRCTAVKVVMVHDSVADTLVAKVMEKVAKLTVGKPEDNCDVRSLTSRALSSVRCLRFVLACERIVYNSTQPLTAVADCCCHQ